jgi:hypothetical protein
MILAGMLESNLHRVVDTFSFSENPDSGLESDETSLGLVRSG